ncbi:MAG: MFS transporter [Ignavibacteriae bacterium]|nr:MFS transporter [Ignavibacteriota bacterium]MCB9206434.1 MFS transporter [Ignavibacteriales bacterium]MCB9210687.1 MFS transporter [Ignavibacteriales bacterium]MCB9219648.1 MFS transporter [Ignavibacteriales bacterium]MCB9259964.1 MFS transporter [Ignavibacteriales bacterium]
MEQLGQKLQIKEKVGYGLGDFAANIVFQTVMIFLMYYYTDIFGIPVAAVGTLFLLSRIWDAVNDPIMGAIADRTKSKHGRFRPWIKWTALPFGIVAVLMFTTPDFSVDGKIVYAYVTYILMMMIYTANNIPYGALSGVMTSDSIERTSLNSYRFVFGQSAALAIQGLTLPLIALLGAGNKALGYQLTMALFAVIAVGLFYITFYTTKERIEPAKSQKTPIKDDLKDLMQNRPWMILFFMGLVTFIFLSLRIAVGLYYFQYYVGDESLFSMFAVLGTIGLIIGIPLSKPLTRKFGKRNTYIMSNILSGIAVLALFLPTPEQWKIAYIISALVGFFNGPGVPILWAMYADTADYAEWKFGRRATGIVFSAATFGQKFGWGIGGAITGWLLAMFNYEPNTIQSSETILGIKLMLSIIPGALMILSVILLFFYNLTEPMMEKVQSELADRRLVNE